MNRVYLALGSNLGDKKANIQQAYVHIIQEIGPIVKYSSFAESKPVGFQSSNDFVNTVIELDTELNPEELLMRTQEIEKRLGRTHKSVAKNYSDRTIDIDILLFNQEIIERAHLQIPHPGITERAFVYEPLLEICPDITLPHSSVKLKELIV